jgi:MFS family permease
LNRRSSPGLALGVIGLGTSLPAADTAVNVALPAIAQGFNVDTAAIRWVVIGYVFVYACLMILMGHLGDRSGHWRVFRWGLWSGLLAYAWCSLAPTYALLVVGRGLQGVSTALLLAVGPALALDVLGASNHTRALAYYGAIGAVAAALAPLLAGWAIGVADWPAVFGFRLPILLLALLLLAIWGATADKLPTTLRSASPAWARLGPTLSKALRAHLAAPLFGLHLLHAWAHACGFTSMLLVPFLLAGPMKLTPLAVGAMLGLWPTGMALGNLLGSTTVKAYGLLASVRTGLCTVGLGSAALALAAFAQTPSSELSIPWIAQLPAVHQASGSEQLSAEGLLPALQVFSEAWHILGAGLLVQGMGLGLLQMAYTAQVLVLAPKGQDGLAGAATLSSRTLGVLLAALLWPWLLDAGSTRGLPWPLGLAALYTIATLSLGFMALSRRPFACTDAPPAV